MRALLVPLPAGDETRRAVRRLVRVALPVHLEHRLARRKGRAKKSFDRVLGRIRRGARIPVLYPRGGVSRRWSGHDWLGWARNGRRTWRRPRASRSRCWAARPWPGWTSPTCERARANWPYGVVFDRYMQSVPVYPGVCMQSMLFTADVRIHIMFRGCTFPLCFHVRPVFYNKLASRRNVQQGARGRSDSDPGRMTHDSRAQDEVAV